MGWVIGFAIAIGVISAVYFYQDIKDAGLSVLMGILASVIAFIFFGAMWLMFMVLTNPQALKDACKCNKNKISAQAQAENDNVSAQETAEIEEQNNISSGAEAKPTPYIYKSKSYEEITQ